MSRTRLAQVFVALAALLLVAGFLVVKLKDPTCVIREGMSIEQANAAMKGNAYVSDGFCTGSVMILGWRTRRGRIEIWFENHHVSKVAFTPDGLWDRFRRWIRS